MCATVIQIHEIVLLRCPRCIYVYYAFSRFSWKKAVFSEKRWPSRRESVALARGNKSAEKAEILSFKSADIKSVMKLRNKGEV